MTTTPSLTHYIAYFTVEEAALQYRDRRVPRQARLRTVCGAWLNKDAHTTEPTCPTCRAWLEQEADDTVETARGLGLELKDGLLVPKAER